MLKNRLRKHRDYLQVDDKLLKSVCDPTLQALDIQELQLAVEERGR